jgi:hypothetical protein
MMLPFMYRKMAVTHIHLRRIKMIRRMRGKSIMVVVADSFSCLQEMRVEKVQGAVKLGALLILQKPYLCAGVDPTISVWCHPYIKSGGNKTKRSQISRSLSLQHMQERFLFWSS